jgi:hypothetical protein
MNPDGSNEKQRKPAQNARMTPHENDSSGIVVGPARRPAPRRC